MDGEHALSTDGVRFAQKKDRLSQVVDKLAVLGNGIVLADKENNNVTDDTEIYSSEPMSQLQRMTPQLASTVPQTHQVVQQTATIIPNVFNSMPQLPIPLDTFTKIPGSMCFPPPIGTTIPNMLPILPDTGPAMLHNFLMYGEQNDLPPHLYKFNNSFLNFWQYNFNIQQQVLNNFQHQNLNNDRELNLLPISVEDIKQEPEEEEESDMIIDESPWEDSNMQTINKSFQHEIGSRDKVNGKMLTSFEPVQQDLPPNFGHTFNFKPQLASTVPQTYQAVQQTASTIGHGSNHIPIPIAPSQICSTQANKAKYFPTANSHDVSMSKLRSEIHVKTHESETQKNHLDVKTETKSMRGSTSDTDSEASLSGRSNPSPQSLSGFQNVPLDLSIKTVVEIKKGKSKDKTSKKSPREQKKPPNQEGLTYPEVRGDVASPTTRESVAARYNIEVSPVVEQMPDGSDTAWACPVCGQLFSQKDRLAKHVACRHRGRSPSRTHVCWTCNRGFSRSDMLTRHLRLHTGQKPYHCEDCGQIFSRSDHLATHRRTHTGEKPYKCPQCKYSACRRDMITRHMRTHRPSTSTNSKSPKST